MSDISYHYHIAHKERNRSRSFETGYHGGRGEGENGLLQQTMEAVRREAERQDYYGGTVVLHSLSGGTGSGKHYGPTVNMFSACIVDLKMYTPLLKCQGFMK